MNRILDLFRDLGAGFSRFTERWVPDSWVVCMMLTGVALVLAYFVGDVGLAEAGQAWGSQQYGEAFRLSLLGGEKVVLAWGSGMWNLLELAMQFTIAMVAAHACVSSRPVFNLLDRLAAMPDPNRPLQAILLASIFSLITAYLNWAFCLVSCALFVPFLCRRNPKADVRLLVVACYLGLGTVWHGGFSGSAPLILATPDNFLVQSPDPVLDRLYPVTETLFTSFNLIYLFCVGGVGLITVMALHPRRDVMTLSPDQVEAILPAPPPEPPVPSTPAGRVEHMRIWVLLAAVLILYPLGHSMFTGIRDDGFAIGFGTTWTINAYNMVFLSAALLLHGRPESFVNACRQGVGAAWGIILQFPFYAGIFGVMTGTGLGDWLGELFASIATTRTYPAIVYVYSGVMNLFVPSAGSKWVIEAPFLIAAGKELDVSVTTLLLAYMYGDSTTNLIQPFWAIPILAVTRLRFGDIVGYTFLVAVVCFVFTLAAMFFIPTNL